MYSLKDGTQKEGEIASNSDEKQEKAALFCHVQLHHNSMISPPNKSHSPRFLISFSSY